MVSDDVLGLARVAKEVVGLVKQPLEAMLGPAASELAGAWGDKVKHWRDMRRLERALDTVRLLQERGVEPQAVDPSLLFPILDAASLADDAELKRRWAAMLANAADPASASSVLPSFPKILSELTPLEVAVLDYLADESQGRETEAGDTIQVVESSAVQAKFKIEKARYRLVYDNLLRLGLLWQHAGSMRMTPLDNPSGSVSIMPNHWLILSELGLAFVKACRYQ